MKRISAEIIADSVNGEGDRITSFVLTFPRIILSEINTHRIYSRNSASSRAIPFKKMVEMVKNDPFIPIAFQKDHSGMQGSEYLEHEDLENAIHNWLNSKDAAVYGAEILNDIGVTKQLCNRTLEPYMWHTAIVTATEFENFFKLRCPQYEFTIQDDSGVTDKIVFRSRKDAMKYFSDARTGEDHDGPSLDEFTSLDWLKMNKGAGEIHIMELAEQMWDALNENTPKQLKAGEWHIPFGDRFDDERVAELFPGIAQLASVEAWWEYKVKIATARCARISYENYEGGDDYEKDINLHDRLAKMGHWSPFEHCAQALDNSDFSGNFKGFTQYRKTFSNEAGLI